MSIATPTTFHYFYPTPKIFTLVALGLGLFSVILYAQRDYFYTKTHAYACASIEKQLGSVRVTPQQETFILQIAQEMGVLQPIIIRKMNRNALLHFGYHNAFVIFPLIMRYIPVGTTPFLFISEGFFDDLSIQEQRFLIGHEMVHIKEQHFRSLYLFLYLLFFALLIMGFFIYRYTTYLIQKYIKRYQVLLSGITFSVLLFICFLIPRLVEAHYRKNKEREADYHALSLLQVHDGCISLLNRWEHQWGVPLHNPYYGLFADHPSTHERKTYCLALKNNEVLLS